MVFCVFSCVGIFFLYIYIVYTHTIDFVIVTIDDDSTSLADAVLFYFYFFFVVAEVVILGLLPVIYANPAPMELRFLAAFFVVVGGGPGRVGSAVCRCWCCCSC